MGDHWPLRLALWECASSCQYLASPEVGAPFFSDHCGDTLGANTLGGPLVKREICSDEIDMDLTHRGESEKLRAFWKLEGIWKCVQDK